MLEQGTNEQTSQGTAPIKGINFMTSNVLDYIQKSF